MLYFDHNATTPLLPEVRDFLVDVAGRGPLNASSSHRAGAAARELIEDARERIGALVNCDPDFVIFTSSGTESNGAVLQHSGKKGSIITTTIEHSSIVSTCEHLQTQGVNVWQVPVSQSGVVSAEEVEKLICEVKAKEPLALVSIQWANNETGAIQPVREIAAICVREGVSFHVDAAQAVGKTVVDLDKIPVDFLTFTGHKLHAPAGVGVLIAKKDVTRWVFGGDQERRRRAGTENVIGIAALGKAAEIRLGKFPRLEKEFFLLRNEFESGVLDRFPWVRVNANDVARIPNTSNITFTGLDGQAIMAQLDVAGICVSQSSACTNHRPEPSYVLRAMGRTEAEAYASIRFSFGETNTPQELRALVKELSRIVVRLSSMERRA